MTQGNKVVNRGPGVISGNLSFIGAFSIRDDAEDYYDECLVKIDPYEWDIIESDIKEINERYVVRILAVKKQKEFDFGD